MSNKNSRKRRRESHDAEDCDETDEDTIAAPKRKKQKIEEKEADMKYVYAVCQKKRVEHLVEDRGFDTWKRKDLGHSVKRIYSSMDDANTFARKLHACMKDTCEYDDEDDGDDDINLKDWDDVDDAMIPPEDLRNGLFYKEFEYEDDADDHEYHAATFTMIIHIQKRKLY
eukprot:597693_1